MKAKRISALIALSLLTFSLVAFAQQAATVGELLDKGGKKLTKDELAKLVPSATISGITTSGSNVKLQYTYKDDGSLSGNVFNAVGGSFSSGVFGKWSLNDQGQLCSDIQNARSGNKYQFCSFYFSLGTAYFIAPTDDKMATLLEREVKR